MGGGGGAKMSHFGVGFPTVLASVVDYSQFSLTGHLYKTDNWCWSPRAVLQSCFNN